MTDYQERRQLRWMVLIFIVAAYLGVSCCVFAYRHPWMTDTERSLHIFDAMLRRTVER